MYECDKCIPSHTKLLLASLQSRSATPLTTQQVAGFVCRPAYTKHAEPEMELRLDSVCCCMALIKRFISSLWRFCYWDFVRVSDVIHMDCVCQVGSFAFHLSDFVGPTCICISPYLRSQKGPQRTYKARTVSIG